MRYSNYSAFLNLAQSQKQTILVCVVCAGLVVISFFCINNENLVPAVALNSKLVGG